MADILSQEEVDLLLSAVSEGELAQEKEEETLEPTVGRDITTYDFRRPERVSKEQLKGLQSFFEAFARELSIMLPPFLRTVVRVDIVSIDQLTYDEFILSVARPTSLSIINMSPLDGTAVLELSLGLVFPVVDRLLGGKGMPLSEPRELTEIEDRVVHRVVIIILDCFRRSWEQLVEFNLSIAQQESDPLIVQIVAGSEMVILVSYEVHIGETTGSMNICIPLMVLNPVLDRISQQTHVMRRMSHEMAAAVRTQLVKALRKVTVPVTAVLGHARLPVDEVTRLQIGDIIQLNSDVKEPIFVEVSGLSRFKARPGRCGELSAVQVTDLAVD